MIFVVSILIIVLVETMKKLSGAYPFDYNTFAVYLGQSESGNDYSIHSNGIAYGRYQFTPSTIQTIAAELEIPTPSIDDFLANTKLQDTFYRQYVSDLINQIVNDKDLYSSLYSIIIGQSNKIQARINMYGLVAGAWLGGAGNLKNLLLNNHDTNDGHTYVSDYVAKFSQLLSGVI